MRRVVYLQAGETIDAALIGIGVRRVEAAEAARLVDTAIFPNVVPAGTPIEVVLDKDDGPTARRLVSASLRPRLDLAVTIQSGASGLSLVPRPIPIDASPLELRGTVGADLTQSLMRLQTSSPQVAAVSSALREHLDQRMPLRPTDRFELVFEQARAEDGQLRTGALLYAAVRRDDRPLVELVQWRSEAGLSDVAASAQTHPDQSASALPVNGHLTSRYGPRFHPILGYTRMHAGVDLGAPWGAPVVAAASGTVVVAGWHGGHGNYVRLSHQGGLASGYAHLSRIAVGIGASVRAGQVIGFVGSTGLSTGPHLHYEVFSNGRPVDPLRDGMFTVSRGSSRSQAFATAVASLRSLVKAP